MSISISVITPSFNHGRFIEATIKSVIAQRYATVQHIIMDGGSRDETLAILSRYDAHIAHWESGPDAGQADALAKGIARSTGEIIGWLNSDDVLAPGALEHVARFFSRRPDVDILAGSGCYMDQDGRAEICKYGLISRGRKATWRQMLLYEQDGLFQPSIFWRRRAYRAAGGVDPRWKFIMDREFFYRMLKVGCRLGTTDRLLSLLRVHPDAKSYSIQPIRRREVEEMLRESCFSVSSSTRSFVYAQYYMASIFRKLIPYLGAKLGLIGVPDEVSSYLSAIHARDGADETIGAERKTWSMR